MTYCRASAYCMKLPTSWSCAWRLMLSRGIALAIKRVSCNWPGASRSVFSDQKWLLGLTFFFDYSRRFIHALICEFGYNAAWKLAFLQRTKRQFMSCQAAFTPFDGMDDLRILLIESWTGIHRTVIVHGLSSHWILLKANITSEVCVGESPAGSTQPKPSLVLSARRPWSHCPWISSCAWIKSVIGLPKKVQKFQKIVWHTLIARLRSEENLGLFSG